MQSPDNITDRPEATAAFVDRVPDQAAVIAPDVPPPVLDARGFRTAPDHAISGWPPGVPYIVGNEACERFSFYGMRAILQVHLTALFAVQAWIATQQDARTAATQVVHLFMAGVYAFPMIGALIADRWVGKYRTILVLSLVYCAGHAVLAGFENELWGMYLGLALISIGSGGIKPCVSANVGDQFGRSNSHLVRIVYMIFYFSINFGSFFATLLIPLLRSRSGYWLMTLIPSLAAGVSEEDVPRYALRLGTSVAFGLPGVLMFLATFIFWLGRRKFVHVPPRPGGRIGLLDAVCSASLFMSVGHLFFTPHLLHGGPFENNAPLRWGVQAVISAAFLGLGLYLFVLRQKIQPDDGFFAITLHVLAVKLGLRPAEPNTPRGFWGPGFARYGPATEGPIAVFKIISVFLLISVFWALFDQHSSTWITQAGELDLRLWGDRESFLGIRNVTLESSQTPAMNPLMVMLFIPLMNVVYGLFDRLGLKTTPLRRVTVGTFFTAASFVATALLQQSIDAAAAAGSPKSIWWGWQAIQYVLITLGEVMVSITGLEFAYTQAPRKMKSTVMGFWLLTVTLGNVLVYLMAGVQKQLTAWVSENVAQGLSQAATFFWFFAALSAVAGVLFGLRALFYVPKDYAQE